MKYTMHRNVNILEFQPINWLTKRGYSVFWENPQHVARNENGKLKKLYHENIKGFFMAVRLQ